MVIEKYLVTSNIIKGLQGPLSDLENVGQSHELNEHQTVL